MPRPQYKQGVFRGGEAPSSPYSPFLWKRKGARGMDFILESGRFGGTHSLHHNLTPLFNKERGKRIRRGVNPS